MSLNRQEKRRKSLNLKQDILSFSNNKELRKVNLQCSRVFKGLWFSNPIKQQYESDSHGFPFKPFKFSQSEVILKEPKIR